MTETPDESTLTAFQRAVLHGKFMGHCNKTLARQLGCSQKAVVRMVSRLRDKGFSLPIEVARTGPQPPIVNDYPLKLRRECRRAESRWAEAFGRLAKRTER